MDLSIIIVSFNTKDVLKKCLESLYRFTRDLKYEVIVVDNNSRDGSVEILNKNFPKIKLIVNIRNQGFSKAVNQGIKIAAGSYILLLNSDTLIIDNSLKLLVDVLKENENIAIIGPKLLNPDLSLNYSCKHFSSFLNRSLPFIPIINRILPDNFKQVIEDENFYLSKREVDYMWGACLMFRRSVIEKLKGLDERFFLYSEEEDFCFRAKQQGLKTLYYPNASIVHIGKVSSLKVQEKAYKQLFYSLYLFFKKHYGILYAISFRLFMVLIMISRIFSYKFFTFSIKKKRNIYNSKKYKIKLILQAYLPGKKSFFP